MELSTFEKITTTDPNFSKKLELISKDMNMIEKNSQNFPDKETENETLKSAIKSSSKMQMKSVRSSQKKMYSEAKRNGSNSKYDDLEQISKKAWIKESKVSSKKIETDSDKENNPDYKVKGKSFTSGKKSQKDSNKKVAKTDSKIHVIGGNNVREIKEVEEENHVEVKAEEVVLDKIQEVGQEVTLVQENVENSENVENGLELNN